MSSNRTKMQSMLEMLQTKAGETPHVYYQPPETVKMSYPCFVYNLDDNDSMYANNVPYLNRDVYNVTYITRSPEPVLAESMRTMPKTKFIRHFTSDNLHHFVFTISSPWVMQHDELDLKETVKTFLGE